MQVEQGITQIVQTYRLGNKDTDGKTKIGTQTMSVYSLEGYFQVPLWNTE